MKIIALMFVLALPAMAGEWVTLFDGKTLNGWTNQGEANWAVNDGAITVSSGGGCLLTTKEKYENYEFEVEFKAAPGTNSGIFLNTVAKVKDPGTDCYEINIAPPGNPFPTGSIVKHHKVEGQGEKDEWRSYKLKVLNGTVTITLDGKMVLTHKAAKPRPAGYIGLQKNSGTVSFREIRVKKLD